jgi:hypothetical protein
MVGIAARLAQPIGAEDRIKAAYDGLLADPKFQESTTRATADEENVRSRLQLAKDAFKAVP